jgi:hypothetical protein
LYQYIQYIAFLIDGPPQVVVLSFDLDEHLIQVPTVTMRACPPLTSGALRILNPKPQAPLSH